MQFTAIVALAFAAMASAACDTCPKAFDACRGSGDPNMASCAAADAECTNTCITDHLPQDQAIACIKRVYEGIPMGQCN
ncbi:hypothetical protein DL769_005290 [Monosporascus sp. CRB-8-3]|nr:hypothetical protein DL769_005290 [Monosporascus sp. CRB-8-3]